MRDNTFDPEKLARGRGNIAEFQAAHAARPGYRGSIVVDVGAGRQIALTLWHSEQEAEAARIALGPVIQHALVPLMAKSSTLVGVLRPRPHARTVDTLQPRNAAHAGRLIGHDRRNSRKPSGEIIQRRRRGANGARHGATEASRAWVCILVN